MLRLAVAVCLLAGAGLAQERRLLDAAEAVAFRAVGRLNVAGRRFCTATLIEPAVIVTAAHCLFHPQSRRRVPLSEFRFVAGLWLGENAALRRVVRSAVHPDFAFDGAPDLAGVRADLALLELDRPVDDSVAPFDTAPLRGGPLAIVSYARDRPQAPSIEEPCVMVATVGDLAALDCAVTFGVSGAPVLAGQGESMRVVAVVSAMGRTLDGSDVSLTVAVEPAIETLRATLAEAPLELPVPAPRP